MHPLPSVLRFWSRLTAPAVFLLTPLALCAADATPSAPSTRVSLSTIILFTLGLFAWFGAVWWTRQAILERLKQLAVQKTRSIASQRLRRVSIKRIIQLARIGTRLATVALMLTGFFAWVILVLASLTSTHDFAVQLEHLVIAELETLALAAVSTIPDLIIVGVIFFVTRLVHELLNHYFESIISGEVESAVFDPVTAETTRRLADLGVWIAAIIIAFPYIPGSHSAAFRGVSVVAGLMLSLGSANLVGQFASGLSLIYGRALRPGEYIEVGATEGTVERIGLFACSLRTCRDEVVVLPHTAIAAGLKHYSRGDGGVRFAATVTIGYDAPWRQVRDLLLAAARDTAGIRADLPPNVRQAGLEDFYVSYELLFTPEVPADRKAVLGRLHEAIQDRFHASGVQIMSPHYNMDPSAPKLPPTGPAA